MLARVCRLPKVFVPKRNPVSFDKNIWLKILGIIITSFFLLALPLRAEEQNVLLDLVINQDKQNPSLVILEGENVWVKTKDLESAGLENFTGEQKLIKGENYTALNSLNKILSYQINLEKFSLDLTCLLYTSPSPRD